MNDTYITYFYNPMNFMVTFKNEHNAQRVISFRPHTCKSSPQ